VTMITFFILLELIILGKYFLNSELQNVAYIFLFKLLLHRSSNFGVMLFRSAINLSF
jgi:hypothetical protein